MRLEFEPPDLERFRRWGWDAKRPARAGRAGAVLNAANEAAVAGFLSGELKFTEIVPTCRSVSSIMISIPARRWNA